MSFPCFADKYIDPGMTTLFERIIDAKGESADALYDKCLVWCKKNFITQNGSTINYADKNSHMIRAFYVDLVRYSWPDATSSVDGLMYDLKIDTKNGRVRVRMQLIEYRVTTYHSTWISGGPKNEAKGKSESAFEDLVSSIEDELFLPEEDW